MSSSAPTQRTSVRRIRRSRARSTASAGTAAFAATPGCRCRRPRARHAKRRRRADEVELPLRGKALRDKIVLRIIALDRAFHFVVLAFVAVAVFLVARNQLHLRHSVFRLVNAVQGTSGDPTGQSHGILHTVLHALELRSSTLYWVAAGAAAYAVLEGAEAVGLWLMKRWAEYLTFIATTAFVPYEIYELTNKVSWFKILALVVNLVIVVYLLFAKRLFGLRGGAAAEERERARDQGWSVLDETAP